MPETGELIVGAWLQEVADCEFVEYGVRTQNQGEIDVVGLSLRQDRAYLCEAATHIQGLWYADTTEAQTEKLVAKFQRVVGWAESTLSRFPNRTYMLWAPVIAGSGPRAKLDSAKSVEETCASLRLSHGIQLQVMANSTYQDALAELREKALELTSPPASSILRMMQVEEWTKKHLASKRFKSNKNL